MWTGAIVRRFTLVDPDFVAGTLGREADTRVVDVPAGSFEVQHTTLLIGDRTGSWRVEVAPSYRLVRWAWSDGEVGALTGSVRTPHWWQSGLRDIGSLPEIGRLAAGAPRRANRVRNVVAEGALRA